LLAAISAGKSNRRAFSVLFVLSLGHTFMRATLLPTLAHGRRLLLANRSKCVFFLARLWSKKPARVLLSAHAVRDPPESARTPSVENFRRVGCVKTRTWKWCMHVANRALACFLSALLLYCWVLSRGCCVLCFRRLASTRELCTARRALARGPWRGDYGAAHMLGLAQTHVNEFAVHHVHVAFVARRCGACLAFICVQSIGPP